MLVVLGGVDLVGVIAAGINHAEGVALRDQALEGTLVEDIDEFLLEDHLIADTMILDNFLKLSVYP